jgi:hypothetical protein
MSSLAAKRESTSGRGVTPIVSGEILQVFVADPDGKSVPYDWRNPKAEN